MTQGFRSFVIFAGMRTGSNLLEATLNAIKGVTCFGEAFNPYMMGWPDKADLLGVTADARQADPLPLLGKLTNRPGHLPGFRYFPDHDPRVLDPIIRDRRCAKIILTRNPLDSYVSIQLARQTNQWKLNAEDTPIPARIRYDDSAFRQDLIKSETFRRNLLHRLQSAGQTPFWLDYDDLHKSRILTGLLHWLGRTDLDHVQPSRDMVPQNPEEMADKVINFDKMQADLRSFDPFGLHRIPNFEIPRGAGVPGFLAGAAGRGLIFMPIRGGPDAGVGDWLALLGPVQREFSQSSLRQWKRQRPGHRSFCVLRHPLHRAWSAYESVLARPSPDQRNLLRKSGMPLPSEDALPHLTQVDRTAGFDGFLAFLRRNLNGQTSLPTPATWASQTEVLTGYARFGPADLLARENRLPDDMVPFLRSAGLPDTFPPQAEPLPDHLRDPELAKAAQAAYLRDYITFGFDLMP